MIYAEASPNIALIKYWGKKESTSDQDRNIGVNPSLSMTLKKAKTFVNVTPLPSSHRHEILINGQFAKDEDQKKILVHIKRIEDHFKSTHPNGAGFLKIDSKNNFPASAGIASSASSFAALTIAICSAIIGKSETAKLLAHHPETLSTLARRGSGSAARSVCGGFMRWDTTHAESLYLSWPLLDTIVMLSDAPKNISSSEGHRRALTSPYFAERQKNLPRRIDDVLQALKNKNLNLLGPLIETEALEMHHIAETSLPRVNYLNEDAKKLIRAIQELPHRNFYFTIDAGPNLHLISEEPIVDSVKDLLKNLNIQAEIWEDGLGTGPSLE